MTQRQQCAHAGDILGVLATLAPIALAGLAAHEGLRRRWRRSWRTRKRCSRSGGSSAKDCRAVQSSQRHDSVTCWRQSSGAGGGNSLRASRKAKQWRHKRGRCASSATPPPGAAARIALTAGGRSSRHQSGGAFHAALIAEPRVSPSRDCSAGISTRSGSKRIPAGSHATKSPSRLPSPLRRQLPAARHRRAQRSRCRRNGVPALPTCPRALCELLFQRDAAQPGPSRASRGRPCRDQWAARALSSAKARQHP